MLLKLLSDHSEKMFGDEEQDKISVLDMQIKSSQNISIFEHFYGRQLMLIDNASMSGGISYINTVEPAYGYVAYNGFLVIIEWNSTSFIVISLLLL